jgi:hypothetical protein
MFFEQPDKLQTIDDNNSQHSDCRLSSYAKNVAHSESILPFFNIEGHDISLRGSNTNVPQSIRYEHPNRIHFLNSAATSDLPTQNKQHIRGSYRLGIKHDELQPKLKRRTSAHDFGDPQSAFFAERNSSYKKPLPS